MTVTVWATFQVAAVKVSAAGATVPSLVSPLDRAIAHIGRRLRGEDDREGGGAAGLSGGCPEIVLTVMPTASSSVLLTLTSVALNPL